MRVSNVFKEQPYPIHEKIKETVTMKPEDLLEHGYLLLDKLEHKDLNQFVRTYLQKRNLTTAFYFISNVVCVLLIIFFFALYQKSEHLKIGTVLLHFFYGFFIAFALIPLHEYIHILAYKSQGARETSYDVNFKKFHFLAVAHKFPAIKKEFQIVALAPFVIISSLLIILSFFVDHTWLFTTLGILFIHTSFCAGDFALLSYFACNKDKAVITYDDKDNKVSYFYGKII